MELFKPPKWNQEILQVIPWGSFGGLRGRFKVAVGMLGLDLLDCLMVHLFDTEC